MTIHPTQFSEVLNDFKDRRMNGVEGRMSRAKQLSEKDLEALIYIDASMHFLRRRYSDLEARSKAFDLAAAMYGDGSGLHMEAHYEELREKIKAWESTNPET